MFGSRRLDVACGLPIGVRCLLTRSYIILDAWKKCECNRKCSPKMSLPPGWLAASLHSCRRFNTSLTSTLLAGSALRKKYFRISLSANPLKLFKSINEIKSFETHTGIQTVIQYEGSLHTRWPTMLQIADLSKNVVIFFHHRSIFRGSQLYNLTCLL